MSKYRLSYFKDNHLESIDLSDIYFLKEKKLTEIKTIDYFTTQFYDLEELLNFLKKRKLIPENINQLYITIDKKYNDYTINKKIYNGEILLFDDDLKYLKPDFISKWTINNKNNKEIIYQIADNYIKKYTDNEKKTKGPSHILSALKSLKRLCSIPNLDMNEYSSIDYEFNDCIKELIKFELYKTDIVEGKIVTKKDKNNKSIIDYRGMHDFLVLIKTIDNALNVKKPKEIEKPEEFLFEEDFYRAREEILKNYNEEHYEEQDGNDYNVVMNKEELSNAYYSILNGSLKKTIRKGKK